LAALFLPLHDLHSSMSRSPGSLILHFPPMGFHPPAILIRRMYNSSNQGCNPPPAAVKSPRIAGIPLFSPLKCLFPGIPVDTQSSSLMILWFRGGTETFAFLVHVVPHPKLTPRLRVMPLCVRGHYPFLFPGLFFSPETIAAPKRSFLFTSFPFSLRCSLTPFFPRFLFFRTSHNHAYRCAPSLGR